MKIDNDKGLRLQHKAQLQARLPPARRWKNAYLYSKSVPIMFKLLITGALVYFIYRFFIAPPAIDQEQGREQAGEQPRTRETPIDDEEYIDYEEVE